MPLSTYTRHTTLGSRHAALLSARWGRVKLHFAAVTGLWIIDLVGGSPVVTLLSGGLLMAILYVKLALDELRVAPLWLSPLSFYFFWQTVNVGAAAIYVAFFILSGGVLEFGPWTVSAEEVAAGYLIFLTGSLTLHAGLQYSRPRPLDGSDHATASAYSNASFMTLLGVMYVVGLIALMKPTLTDALGNALSPLVLCASLTALSCFALMRSELDLSPFSFALNMALGTAGLVVGALNSGSKAQLMFALLPLFWFSLLYRRRWLPVIAAIGLLTYPVVWQVVSLSRANTRYYADKQSLNSHDELANQMLDAFHQWVRGERYESDHPDDADKGTVDEFLLRQFQPLPVGFIAHEVREGGLLMGASLEYVGYALVPRLIWPDKPRVIRGGWFTYMLGMADSPDSATTNLAQNAQGELYWNFGLPGVTLGMGLIGVLLGKLWQMASDDPRADPLRMMLYLLVTLSLQEMAEAGTTLVNIISQFLVFGTALHIQATLGKEAGSHSIRNIAPSKTIATSRNLAAEP